jgi:hypothetical protein
MEMLDMGLIHSLCGMDTEEFRVEGLWLKVEELYNNNSKL